MMCYQLLKNGHEFVTEGIFANGKGRADIINISLGICLEIVCTEQEESILRKMNKYPIPIEIIKAMDFSKVTPT
jgi:hypothetical protein